MLRQPHVRRAELAPFLWSLIMAYAALPHVLAFLLPFVVACVLSLTDLVAADVRQGSLH